MADKQYKCRACGAIARVPSHSKEQFVECPACDELIRVSRIQLAAPVRLAIVAVLIVGAVITYRVIRQKQYAAKVLELSEAATQAYQDEAFEQSIELLQQLSGLRELDPAEKLNLALAHAEVGELSECRELMGELNQIIHMRGVTDLWLAKDLLSRDDRDQTHVAGAEQHLERVLEENPRHREAHRLLLNIKWRHMRIQEALPHMEELAGESDTLAFSLVETYRKLGMSNQASLKARQILKSLTDSQPGDPARIKAARAALLMANDVLAEQLLTLGIKVRGTEDEAWNLALAELHGYRAMKAANQQRVPGGTRPRFEGRRLCRKHGSLHAPATAYPSIGHRPTSLYCAMCSTGP